MEVTKKRFLEIEIGTPLDIVERQFILFTLEYLQGNRTKTADQLGISVRGLRMKLAQYGFSPNAVCERGE